MKTVNTSSLTDLSYYNSIAATSSSLDCAVTYLYNSILTTYKVNTVDTTPIAAWAVVTGETSLNDAGKVNAAISAGKIGVSAGCNILRVGDLAFIKNSGGTAYAKSTVIAGLTAAPVFDNELNFAYSNEKVYQFGTSEYAEVFTVADLKSTVKIYASDDKKKVLLLSY